MQKKSVYAVLAIVLLLGLLLYNRPGQSEEIRPFSPKRTTTSKSQTAESEQPVSNLTGVTESDSDLLPINGHQRWLDPIIIRILNSQTTWNAEGTEKKVVSIVEADFHNPYLRIEETYSIHPYTGIESLNQYIPSIADSVLFRIKPSATEAQIQGLETKLGIHRAEILQGTRILKAKISNFLSVDRLPEVVRSLLSETALIEVAEPDFLSRSFRFIPDDPSFEKQEGFDTDPYRGENADIDAPEAWNIRTDASDVVVAIIDSGINSSHQDLVENLWVNPNEQANGIDDDQNGIVDDLIGANFINGSGDPEDDNGHGTSVAGVIGARGNDGIGIAGVAWDVQLMTLKHSNSFGLGLYSDGIEAIQYAIDQHVDIINNSWGGSGYSILLESALREASNNGILIITAAGNEGNNLAEIPVYPAAFRIPNQLVVGASDEKNRLASFSNYHKELVHLLAPEGAYTASIGEDNSYQYITGTSFSAPYVAGTAALIFAEFPEFNAAQVYNRILDSVEQFEGFNELAFSQGRLNTHRALSGATNIPDNDLFANATSMNTNGETVIGNLSSASKEENEPGLSLNSNSATVWYSWTSPQTDTAHLSLNSPGFDGALTVYTGSSINQLAPVGTSITSRGQNADLSFSADSGTTYFLQVVRTSGSSGLYSFSLALAPPNDLVANAIPLTGESFTTSGSTILASTEQNEPGIHPSGAGNSVWYRWVATQSGPFYLTVDSDNRQTFSAIFEGSPNALTITNFDLDQGLPNRLLLEVQSGKNYYFGVDSQSSEGTTFNLNGQYLEAPRITVQPVDLVSSLGQDAQFSVSVLGTGEVRYQWFKNGVSIHGASQPYIAINSIKQEDEGTYHVEIEINGTTLTSQAASLTLKSESLSILEEPQPRVTTTGSTVRLSVFAQPEGSLTYQWYKNGNQMSGQTGPDLILTNASTGDTAGYHVVVTLGNDSLTSSVANLRVVDGDSIFAGSVIANTPFGEPDLRYVHMAGGVAFALGDEDKFAFSKDGLFWNYNSIPNASDLRSVTYGKDHYIIAADQRLFWSTDLYTWTRCQVPDLTSGFFQVSFGSDAFVATHSSGMLQSSDGRTWSTATIPNSPSMRSVTWAEDQFLGSSISNTIFTSTDGFTWQQAGTANLSLERARLAHGQGKYWTITDIGDPLLSSTDGITWAEESLPEFSYRGLSVDSSTGRVFLLTHSVLWEWKDDQWHFIEKLEEGLNTLGLAVLHNHAIVTIDGWPQRAANFSEEIVTEDRIFQAFFANEKFGAWSGDRLYESEDGIHWSFQNTNLSSGHYDGILYEKNTYVSEAAYGPSLSSMTEHGLNLNALAFGKDRFVGLSALELVYSADGQSWTPSGTSIQASAKKTILFDGEKFIYLSDKEILSSTDGTLWTVESTSGATTDYVLHANDKFLAVAGNGSTRTSTNGISWQAAGSISYPSVSAQVDDVEFFDGKFYATYYGLLYESTDGSSWEVVNTELHGYDADYLVSGNDRLLLFSDLGVAVWNVEEENGGTGDPFLSLSGITSGSTVSLGDSVTISANAIGRGSVIEKFEVFEGETLISQFEPPLSSFQYVPPSIGTHTLRVRVTDTSGGETEKTITINAVRNLYSQVPGGDPYAFGITLFKGAFYAAGPSGIVFQSLDGMQWNRLRTPALHDINGFYSNRLGICAVTTGGEVIFSNNGSSWHLLPLENAEWISRQFEPSFFFIPTSVEEGWVSANGIDWFSAKTGQSAAGDPTAVPDLPYEFVDRFGLIQASPGKPLIESTYPGGEDAQDTTKRGNTVYEAVAEQGVFKTDDGQTWEEIALPGVESYSLVTIQSAGNALFFLQDRHDSLRIRYFSGNGDEWEPVAGPSFIGNIVFKDGHFYCGGTGGFVQSTDGINWNTIGEAPFPQNTSSSYHAELIASPAGFLSVARTEDDKIVLSFSSDGESWKRFERPYHESGFEAIAGGANGILANVAGQTFSLNESTGLWESKPYINFSAKVTSGNGFYLDRSLGEERIWKSDDGVNWTDIVLPEWLDQGEPDAIFFDGSDSFWISYNGENLLARSSDGISWEQKAHPGTLEQQDQLISFEGKLFAERYKSEDNGATWVDSFPGVRQVKLARTESDLLAVVRNSGGPATAFTFESNEWVEIVSPPGPVDFVSAVSSNRNELFMVFGEFIYSSSDGSTWEVVSKATFEQKAISTGDHVFFQNDGLDLLSPSKVDLAIDQVTSPTGEFGVGDELPLGILLKNTGEVDIQTDDSLELQILLSQQSHAWGSGTDGYYHLESIEVNALQLPIGSTKLVNWTLRIPESIQPGAYYLSIHITHDYRLQDINSTNDYWIGSSSSLIIPERTLTLTLTGQGSVLSEKSLLSIPHKQSLELIPNPFFGHQFSNWNGDVEQRVDIANVIMDSDKAIEAIFTERQFAINIDIGRGGTVSGIPAEEYQTLGDNVDLVAEVNDGWQFLGWFGDRISDDPELSISVGRDLNLLALFGQSLEEHLTSRYSEAERNDPEVGGLLADPDGNRFNNLQEYLFGMEAESGQPPEFQIYRRGDELCLLYPQSITTIGDERLEVWYSSDLETWDNSEITSQVVGTERGLEFVEACVNHPGNEPLFFEIRAIAE